MNTNTDSYKCANCDGDHPAVSKSCKLLMEHTNKQKPVPAKPIFKSAPDGFYRNYSSSVNSGNVQPNQSSQHRDYRNPSQNPQFIAQDNNQDGNLYGVHQIITGVLMFITDLIRDLHNITIAIEENNQLAYLDLIERHLGQNQRVAIHKYLNKQQDSIHLSS